MKTFVKSLIWFVFVLYVLPVQAQDAIKSSTAKTIDLRTPKTPLFVHQAATIGEASAKLQLESYSGSADFLWAKFNQADGTYADIQTDIGADASEIVDLGSGGYRVIRSNDGANPTDTLYGWVVMDYLKITSITPINECDVLSLLVNHEVQILYYYYDLSDTPEQRFIMNLNPRIILRASPDDIYDGLEGMPGGWKNTSIRSIIMTNIRFEKPPLVTAKYTAYIENDFNKSEEVSTPEIPAIAVYAAMKAEEQKTDGTWVEATALKGSALYKLRFDHSKSKNADTYTWIAFDNEGYVQTRDQILWTYATNNATDMAYVKYGYMGEELDGYLPGSYRTSLITLNSVTGCKDSIDLQFILGKDNPYIIVEPSKFDSQSLPNVFTPNGDGINDVFKFVSGNEPVSMKTMNLRIFDRAGKELYKYIGRVSDWQGWNGKIKGTGADCNVGVYYYEISGTGWDNVSYSGKPFRGFVHLFKE